MSLDEYYVLVGFVAGIAHIIGCLLWLYKGKQFVSAISTLFNIFISISLGTIVLCIWPLAIIVWLAIYYDTRQAKKRETRQ